MTATVIPSIAERSKVGMTVKLHETKKMGQIYLCPIVPSVGLLWLITQRNANVDSSHFTAVFRIYLGIECNLLAIR